MPQVDTLNLVMIYLSSGVRALKGSSDDNGNGGGKDRFGLRRESGSGYCYQINMIEMKMSGCE